MKKSWLILTVLTLLGNAWVLADGPNHEFHATSELPPVKNTPIPQPTRAPHKHRHHDHKPRILPHLYGMAAFTPTPTLDPNATPTATPTP